MSAPGAIDPPPGTRLQQGKDLHENVDAGHPSLAAARSATKADTSQKPGAAAAGGGEVTGTTPVLAHKPSDRTLFHRQASWKYSFCRRLEEVKVRSREPNIRGGLQTGVSLSP